MGKRRSPTPTQRSLVLLRREGFVAAVVERRLPRCGVTVDAFGLFDLLAIRGDVPGFLGVHTTSGANHAGRVRKLLGNATLSTWLAAGNRAAVWSRTKRRRRWTCRRQRLDAADRGGVASPYGVVTTSHSSGTHTATSTASPSRSFRPRTPGTRGRSARCRPAWRSAGSSCNPRTAGLGPGLTWPGGSASR